MIPSSHHNVCFKRHRDGEKWRTTNTIKVLNCLFPCHYLCIVLFLWPQKLFSSMLPWVSLKIFCLSSNVPQMFPPRKVEHFEMWGTTRKRHPFRYDYKLNNNSLKHVTQVKDLGVTISPDLTWDTHINTILAKANRMLAFLRRNSVMSFTTDHFSPQSATVNISAWSERLNFTAVATAATETFYWK